MPGGHLTNVDGLQPEPHLVAVITPQSPQSGGAPSVLYPAPAPSQLDALSTIDANSAAAPAPLTTAAVTAPSPSNVCTDGNRERRCSVAYDQHSAGAAERVLVFEHDGMVGIDVRVDLVLVTFWAPQAVLPDSTHCIILIGGAKAPDEALAPCALRLTPFLTLLTIQLRAQKGRSSLFRQYPGPTDHWRLMSYVLPMATT